MEVWLFFQAAPAERQHILQVKQLDFKPGLALAELDAEVSAGGASAIPSPDAGFPPEDNHSGIGDIGADVRSHLIAPFLFACKMILNPRSPIVNVIFFVRGYFGKTHN